MNHYKSASAYVQDTAFGTDPSRDYNWRDSPDITIIKRELSEGHRVKGSSGVTNTCHLREAISIFKKVLSCSEEQFNAYIHPGQGAAGTLKPRGGIK